MADNPKISLDAELIAEVLRELPNGGIAAYADLSALIGADVRGKGRRALENGRALAERAGALFVAEKSQGIRRLRADEVPGLGTAARAGILRRSEKALKRMQAQNYNLDQSQRAHLDAEISVIGAAAAIAAGSTVKQARDIGESTPLTPELIARIAFQIEPRK